MPGLLDIGQALAGWDNFKRRVGLLATEPALTARQNTEGLLGNLSNMARANENAAHDMGSVIPEVANAGLERMLPGLVGLAGPTVYHGSPHKFDKFDASRIGTGEGAQAYGHGLYFAENPGVARSYQPPTLKISEARPLPQESMDAWSKGYAALLDKQGDVSAARASLEKQIQIWQRKTKSPMDADAAAWQIPRIKDAISLLDDGAYKIERGPSSFYKVDLPDDMAAKMLDWDKPLSEQPKAFAHLKARGIINDKSPPYQKSGKATPQALLQMPGEAQSMARALADIGIPGIRYLDQGSRGSGQGTYNYVVFPGGEGLLNILSRE